MPTPTITYSLSRIVDGQLRGTYYTALEYAVTDQAEAEAFWEAELARYKATYHDETAQIFRSAVWQKDSPEEHMASIQRANAAVAFDFAASDIWDDRRRH